jgi:protein-S-isoprenylcysteine O-methyltransferase Ste14
MGSQETGRSADRVAGAVRFAFRTSLMIPVQTVILFVAAGRLDWHFGWIHFAVVYLSALLGLSVVGYMNEELARAEVRMPQQTKAWDKKLLSIGLLLMVAVVAVAGLDFRWRWSGHMGVGWRIAGIVGLVGITRVLGHGAMAVNRYWSGTVHVQSGHRVCTAGPYRWVRHPAYLAAVFQFLWTPLILGSWWALLPAALFSITIVVRTALEDRTLRQELPGYAEYAGRVRYRLVPGVW